MESKLGTRWAYAEARPVAAAMYRALKAVAVRVEVVGELRRKRNFVSGLDILVEPMVTPNLFGQNQPDLDIVKRSLARLGVVESGDDPIKVVDQTLGIPVTVSIVRPWLGDDWGAAIAVHTGPRPFTKVFDRKLKRVGVRLEGVRLVQEGRSIACLGERDFFTLMRMDYPLPCERDDMKSEFGTL